MYIFHIIPPMFNSAVSTICPANKDGMYFFILNLCSAFMLSAAHNVLFFVLDFRTPVIHFLHYFFTFLFMILLYNLGCIPKTALPYKEFRVPVLVKLVETSLSAIVHSQNRTGGLYVMRVFDFLFTATIIVLGERYLSEKRNSGPKASPVLFLGLATSLSWFETGQMEYTTFSLLASPFLAILRAASVISIQRAHNRLSQGHIEQFCLYYSGLVASILFLPALISYSYSSVEVNASWESIDYILMSLSFLFMASNMYSDLWLILSYNAKTYATLDHTKYLIASIGQWIIQNMAHPNVLAFGGKILAVSCLFRIWSQS